MRVSREKRHWCARGTEDGAAPPFFCCDRADAPTRWRRAVHMRHAHAPCGALAPRAPSAARPQGAWHVDEFDWLVLHGSWRPEVRRARLAPSAEELLSQRGALQRGMASLAPRLAAEAGWRAEGAAQHVAHGAMLEELGKSLEAELALAAEVRPERGPNRSHARPKPIEARPKPIEARPTKPIKARPKPTRARAKPARARPKPAARAGRECARCPRDAPTRVGATPSPAGPLGHCKEGRVPTPRPPWACACALTSSALAAASARLFGLSHASGTRAPLR